MLRSVVMMSHQDQAWEASECRFGTSKGCSADSEVAFRSRSVAGEIGNAGVKPGR